MYKMLIYYKGETTKLYRFLRTTTIVNGIETTTDWTCQTEAEVEAKKAELLETIPAGNIIIIKEYDDTVTVDISTENAEVSTTIDP